MTGCIRPVSRTGSATEGRTGRRGLCMGFAVSEGLPLWDPKGREARWIAVSPAGSSATVMAARTVRSVSPRRVTAQAGSYSGEVSAWA